MSSLKGIRQQVDSHELAKLLGVCASREGRGQYNVLLASTEG